MWESIKTAVDRNLPLISGALLALAVLAWGYGCTSTTTSPISGTSVNRDTLAAEASGWQTKYVATVQAHKDELQAEIDRLTKSVNGADALAQADISAMQAKLDAAAADLDRKDQLRELVFSAANTAITAIGGPAATSVASLLLAGGAIWNGRRKDIVITALKGRTPTPTAALT